MSLDWMSTATQKELEGFKSVCNQLLSRTYVVRTLYKPGEGRVNNPDTLSFPLILKRYKSILLFWTGICVRTI